MPLNNVLGRNATENTVLLKIPREKLQVKVEKDWTVGVETAKVAVVRIMNTLFR